MSVNFENYRRPRDFGTPLSESEEKVSVTIDGESVTDRTVTVRERDSMQQDRISVDQLVPWVSDRVAG